jgi:hypothetical protein
VRQRLHVVEILTTFRSFSVMSGTRLSFPFRGAEFVESLNRISKKFGFSSVEKELNVVSAVSNVFFGVDTKASSGTPVPPVSEE